MSAAENELPRIVHRTVYGQTLSGKSTLVRQMVSEARKHGFSVAVLDPTMGEWDADFFEIDADTFFNGIEGWLKKTSGEKLVVIDEAGDSLGVGNRERFWLATRGRHYRAHCVFIGHRPASIAPTVRSQCGECIAFTSTKDDAKVIAGDHGEGMLEAVNLRAGEYLFAHWVDRRKVIDQYDAFARDGKKQLDKADEEE